MKTSLVMAVYNGEKYLTEQLDSILYQTKSLDEVIIIDDCSNDGSFLLIQKFINDNGLTKWQLIKNDINLGYKDNFRKGLSLSTGDIIFLSDQDDIWYHDKIEVMLNYMESDNILSLASSFNFIDENSKEFHIPLQKGKSNNNLLFQTVHDKLTKISFKSLLRTNFSQGCAMALKKELVKEFLTLTLESFPHDWTLNMLSAIHDGCYYLDIPLIHYRIHHNNTLGLNDVIENDRVKEINNRSKGQERIKVNTLEQKIVSFAMDLPLNDKQKELCQRKYTYLSTRSDYIEKKKVLSLVLYYFKGKYKEFGKFKTFVGDVISVFQS